MNRPGSGQSELTHQTALHGSGGLARWLRSAIYRNGLLRRIVKSRAGVRFAYTVRVARIVKRPLAFAFAELHKDGATPLVLRRSGATVYVRGRSDDLVMVHQILGRDVYELPVEAQAQLMGIGRSLRVADLGGNIGCFTLRLLERYPNANVLAIEADPKNAELFALTVKANELEAQVDLVDAAASNQAGNIAFSAGHFFQSRVADGDEPDVISIPMIDVLPLLRDRDLIKIDIEGSEWPILFDQRFRELDAAVIALEWHKRGCPTDDPQAAAETALVDAGFTVRHDFSDTACGTLWAWR